MSGENWKTLRVPPEAYEKAKAQKDRAGRTWGEQLVRPGGASNYFDAAEDAEIAGATATTVVPYTDGAERREYELAADEVSEFLAAMDDPQHGERVVNITIRE